MLFCQITDIGQKQQYSWGNLVKNTHGIHFSHSKLPKSNKWPKQPTHPLFSKRTKSLFRKDLEGEQQHHKTYPNSTTLSLFDINSGKMCWVSRTTGRIIVHKSLWKITGLSAIETKAPLGQANKRTQLLAGEEKPLLHSPILQRNKDI